MRLQSQRAGLDLQLERDVVLPTEWGWMHTYKCRFTLFQELPA